MIIILCHEVYSMVTLNSLEGKSFKLQRLIRQSYFLAPYLYFLIRKVLYSLLEDSTKEIRGFRLFGRYILINILFVNYFILYLIKEEKKTRCSNIDIKKIQYKIRNQIKLRKISQHMDSKVKQRMAVEKCPETKMTRRKDNNNIPQIFFRI